MKLDQTFTNPIKPDDFEEKFFSIENPALIFDILRSKIYSKPILAVVREYLCNALDSHVEAGIPEKPIQVTVPSYNEPYFKVKDFGVGISPDRIDNVFVKYTASTKRESNDLIGSWGVGSKAAFAYTESFTIVTNFNGKQYNYLCFIDESKIGKLTLLSECDTDEPNGTEIIVAVKAQDFLKFNDEISFVVKHWKIKPDLINGALLNQFQESSVEYDGGTYKFIRNNSYVKNFIAIVGNIEYKLPYDMLVAKMFGDSRSELKADFILYFDIGEVSLSVSREEIQLNTKTKETINNRLESAILNFKEKVSEELNSFTTLAAATKHCIDKYSGIFNTYYLNKFFPWKDVYITRKVDLPYTCISYALGDRVSRCKFRQLTFDEKFLIITNFGKVHKDDINGVLARKIFDANPDYKIIHFFNAEENYQFDNTQYKLLKYCDQKDISEYYKPKKVSAKEYSGLYYCYDNSTGRFEKSAKKYWNTWTNKAYCQRKEMFTIVLNDQRHHSNILRILPEYDIICFDPVINKEEYLKIPKVEDILKEKWQNLQDKKELFYAKNIANQARFIKDTYSSIVTNNQSSVFSKTIVECDRIINLYNSKEMKEFNILFDIYASHEEILSFNEYMKSRADLSEELKKHYPMLFISRYSVDSRDIEANAEHITNYINMMSI